MTNRKLRLAMGICVAALLAGCGKKQPTTLEDLDNMSSDELEAALVSAAEEATEETADKEEETAEEKEETSEENADDTEETEEAEEVPEEYVFPEAMPEILNARLEDGLVQVNDALLYCNCSFDENGLDRMGQYVTGTFQEEYEQVLSWGMLPVSLSETEQNMDMLVLPGTTGGVQFGDPANLYIGKELMYLHYYNDTEETLKLGECKAVLLPKLSDKGEYALNVFGRAAYFAHGIKCVDGEWNYMNVKELLDAQGYEITEAQRGSEISVMVTFDDGFSRYSANDENLYYRFTFDATTTQLTNMSAMFH